MSPNQSANFYMLLFSEFFGTAIYFSLLTLPIHIIKEKNSYLKHKNYDMECFHNFF